MSIAITPQSAGILYMHTGTYNYLTHTGDQQSKYARYIRFDPVNDG
jgi:hypothetical protein